MDDGVNIEGGRPGWRAVLLRLESAHDLESLVEVERTSMQNHSQETILRRYLLKTIRQSNILHTVESTVPFKEEIGGERGSLKVHVVTNPGSLLSEYPIFERLELMLNVTIVNSCTLCALDAAVDASGSTFAKAISPKHGLVATRAHSRILRCCSI